MKFVNSPEFETISNALNFSTADLVVSGACDLYTTKAGRNDKKLYKTIDKTLESQHESLLRLSASLSPPHSHMIGLNLSRSSPFGSLTEVSNRRAFAYLIATLNASHPDYDFTDVLQPSDFQRETSLQAIMNEIDDLLYSLRPRSIFDPVTVAHSWSGGVTTSTTTSKTKGNNPKMPYTPAGTPAWNSRMWSLMDTEMVLRECDIYRYQPSDDFIRDEGAVWAMHLLFYNKTKKRVAYFYVRGLSAISHSPDTHFTALRSAHYNKRSHDDNMSISLFDQGASKRARFWLGDRIDSEFADDFDGDSWDNASSYSLSDEYEDDDDDDYAEVRNAHRQQAALDEASGKAPRDVNEELSSQMDL